ncbi:MAG: hypothetical protein P8X90_32175 [Desulfobacterales bacterium]|jgi:hypothetical protein
MNNMRLLKRSLLTILTLTLIICWSLNQSGAASEPITPEELEYSGPYEITARIMEIDPPKNMLVVAENKIYVVDVIVGAEHLLTMLADAQGGAITFEAFAPGQTVLVQGLQLPDGRVIAEKIQIVAEQ